jgi:hypothetical protein
MTRTTMLAALAVLLFASLAAAQGPRFATSEDAMRGRPHGAAVQVQTQAVRPMGRVFAHAQAERPLPRAAMRPMRGANVDSGLSAELTGVVAGAFGLTQEELHALKEDGASIADIAAERGVAIATIEAAYLDARNAAIDALLADGSIHEFQAEQMRARGAEAFVNLLEREGWAEGQNVTGERLYANRAAPGAQHPAAAGAAAGRHGRR